MGRSKQTLDWLGEPLVVYQTRQLLEAGMGQVIVVLGHEATAVRPLVEVVDGPRLTIVVNQDYLQGKTASIKAGLRALGSGAASILLLAADQPRPASLLRRLAETHQERGALISIPAHRGKHGHPPIFDASLLPELLEISEEGRGVREVIQRHSGAIHEVEVDDPLVLTNLNTREDYERALALAVSGARREEGE